MTGVNRLIIFTRFPEAGSSKTRLIAELGPNGAARLQRLMTERITDQASRLPRDLAVQVEIHHEGGTKREMTAWLGSQTFVRQVSGDIGRRMRAAFERAFLQKAPAAVLVGSDVPGIDKAILQRAFDELGDNPVVLGPSEDGGYYLVGLQARYAGSLFSLLFETMAWSTDTVLEETLRRLEAARSRAGLLPTLRDIDRPEDLDLARGLGLL